MTYMFECPSCGYRETRTHSNRSAHFMPPNCPEGHGPMKRLHPYSDGQLGEVLAEFRFDQKDVQTWLFAGVVLKTYETGVFISTEPGARRGQMLYRATTSYEDLRKVVCAAVKGVGSADGD